MSGSKRLIGRGVEALENPTNMYWYRNATECPHLKREVVDVES